MLNRPDAPEEKPIPGPTLPRQIGPYRVEAIIGQGGMGVVYRARHAQSGEAVALKTVRVTHPSEMAGIRSEILALGRVRHPNIVRILEGGVHEERPWYSMELLVGHTLSDYLADLFAPVRAGVGAGAMTLTGPHAQATAAPALAETTREEETLAARPAVADDASHARPRPTVRARPVACGGRLPEAMALLHRLCAPLAFLHGQGLVHRDLKPGNIFIRPDLTPVVMDFGLVSRARGSVGRERLEVAGHLVGTAAYIAPEQARGLFVDARGDLYALGCILYETLTGRVPFEGQKTLEVLQRHLLDSPVPPSQVADGVPPELDELCARLLAKRPRDRIGYAEDVAEALARFAEVREPSAPRPSARSYLYRPDLAGRDELVARLAAHVEAAREGRGACVLLGGESGVGKTFLAAETARRAIMKRARVVTGECLPVSASDVTSLDVKEAPLHPLRGLLVALSDYCREKPEQALARTERLLGKSGPVLAAYEPSFATLPGQEDMGPPPELPAQEARRRLFLDLALVLGAFARETPLVLLIDDLQWADELTLGFLGSLGRAWFAAHPVLLVGTYRSDEAGDSLRELFAAPQVERIEVPRLDERTVGAIAGGMLALAEPPAGLVRVLARLSEGNPFFVAEYLRTAVDGGLLERRAGRWVVTVGEGGAGLSDEAAAWEALPLPTTLRDLVGRRLLGLSPSAYALTLAAAVLGRESLGETILVVSGLDEREALLALEELTARQVLEPSLDGAFRFTHDKLREIAYRGADEGRRRALHEAAANALEARIAGDASATVPPSVLAYHHREARQWARAIDYLERAAEQALATFSNHEAKSYAQDALAMAAKVPGGLPPLRLARFDRMLVEAHWELGEHVAGREHAERALSHFGRRVPRSRPGLVLGVLFQVLARNVARLSPSRLTRRGRTAREGAREAQAVFNRMFDALLWNNEPLAAFYCGLRGVNLGETIEPDQPLARGYALLSLILSTTPWKKIARAWAERSLAIAEQLGGPTTLAYCLGRVSGLPLAEARWDEAFAQTMRALAVAREAGNQRAIEEVEITNSYYHHIQGRFGDALDEARRVLASSAARGDGQTQAWARAGIGQALSRLGREAEALRVIDEGRAWVDASGQRLERAFLHAARALAHFARGERQAAREAADLALDWTRRDAVVGFMWHPTVAALAEVYLGLLGDEAGGDAALAASAKRAVAVLVSYARMYPFAQPSALLASSRLRALSGRSDPAQLARALATAQKLGMPFEEASAHVELAAAAPRTDPSERAAHLARAAALFGTLGCTRELLHVRDEQSRAAT